MKHLKIFKHAVAIILAFGLLSTLFAQEEVLKQTLTRGKLWICALPHGSIEDEDNHARRWQDAYPGHYDQNNDITGGESGRIINVAQINGESVGWFYRDRRTLSEVYAIEQTQLHKNYNLIDPTQPEEYFEGVFESFQYDDQNQRHMKYQIKGRVMAWSLPKYDDFIIIKCKLTNTDDVTFENYYYSRYMAVVGPGNPLGTSYDMEYFWDDEVSDDIGFIYYDDTSWNPNADSTIYIIHPGDLTGDRGDPGNIKIEGSTDKKLYSPYLYAMSFLKDYITPNKNGERKVWRNIYSRSGSAPFEDNFPGTDALTGWSTLVDQLTREQPEMSWREAHAQYQPGDLAGSLYERNLGYLYTIGPYDIAPGESIEWIEVWVAGQMDRNITILGDTTATFHFVEEGLKNLKENWAAAKELIENDYQVPRDIPPPTPADAPLIGNDYELLVEPASANVDGKQTAGVNITWKAVHQGYTDPLTGEADFAGYNVYQSDISVEGPWRLVNTLTLAEAEQLTTNGDVTFFQEANVGAPYRYCVTSFDTHGNESGKTGYSHFTVSAEIFASNNLDGIRVVPNPFRQQSGFLDPGERKRMAFLNIPAKCTIRIYTVALDLVRTIEHDGGGEATWGTTDNEDYMLTDFAMNVMPGVYIYHVENHVEGFKGESTVGKIVIIK